MSYGGGEGRVRKFRQEDFQEDDDDKKKSTYNGNSTQQQWTVMYACMTATIDRAWTMLKCVFLCQCHPSFYS